MKCTFLDRTGEYLFSDIVEAVEEGHLPGFVTRLVTHNDFNQRIIEKATVKFRRIKIVNDDTTFFYLYVEE